MYKVLIRPLKIEDAQTSYKWRNDPEIWKYTGSRPDKTITPEIESEWLQKALLDKTTARFAILVDDHYVGNIQLTNIDNNSAQYHIFIGEKQYWGKGIAKLATAQIIRFAQNELKLINLYLKVNPSHIGAIKLYEKCGFKKIDDEITMAIDLNYNPLPMVSVFMITYNHEKFIAQAIESVLEQKTSFDYDIVIGEDCSTDCTREIILNYYHLYPGKFKLLLHTPNIGAMENMLQTLEACKGKYIAMLEGDDYWTDDEKLQRQVDVLETDDSLVLCYHAVSDLFANGIVKRYKRPLFDGDRLVKDVDINCSFLPTLSVVFRNGVINYGSFPIVFNADAFLFGLLSEHGNAYFLDIVAGVYRIHDGGISRSIQSDRSHLKLISTYELLLRELPQKYHSNIKNMIVGTSYNLVINERRFFNWISLKYYCFLFFYCIKYWRISFFLGHSLKLVLDRIGKI